MNVEWIEFRSHGDERGQLVALEQGKEIPFAIKRVYYIFDTLQGVRRGFHAHKALQQVLVCVSGSCKIMLDNGSEKCDVELNSPCKGIVVGNAVWREMYDFSENAVLMVMASELYDENDYIRDYKSFLDYVNKKNI